MTEEKKLKNTFKNDAITRGYTVLSKGWPHYAIIKDEKVVFVTVKKPQVRQTEKQGYSVAQYKMKRLFRQLQLDYKTYRGVWGGVIDE